ncbi:MAG: hypothetical protein EA361_16525 [Bacteroidetes bacterium]|nr:MAG: hypothetical protein EA361_16525 [Bacteroidota bacterium]
MKNQTITRILIAVFAIFLWSCDDKDNIDPVGEWELFAPELTSPADNATIVLDQENPLNELEFTWSPAESEADYQITYSLVIDMPGTTEFENPMFETASENNGASANVSLTHQVIDQALSAAGFEAGESIELIWGVIAKSMDKEAFSTRNITFSRFEDETLPVALYLSGSATEAGTTAADAISLRALMNAEGDLTNVFEIYTSFEAAGTFTLLTNPSEQAVSYGGADGSLVKSGAPIESPGEGTYRLTADFNNNTYEFLEIDRWSLVGNGVPGGWGGDNPLEYIGNGIWEGKVALMDDDSETPRFIFRANGDWDLLMKQITGTANHIYMESQAPNAGYVVEDITVTDFGPHIVTMDLSSDPYVFSWQFDDSVEPPGETPEALFLFADGDMIAQLHKNGNVFESQVHLALQASVSYSLNSEADGSGTAYSLEEALGTTGSPDADKPSGVITFGVGGTGFNVAYDQAFKFSVNFELGSVSWYCFNMKLFHWDDWDERDEFVMTYQHPFIYKITTALSAGYDMKFISPWDVDMGSEEPEELSSTLINGGGQNLVCITQSGNYEVTIEVANDFATGTYVFVAQ